MSLEQVQECPVCKSHIFVPFLICKDFTTSGELFHVEQCNSCGMTFTNPRPTSHNSGAYYQSSDYISHSSAGTGLINYIYLIIRRFTIRWKFKIINGNNRLTTVLDVGCGTGDFLAYLRQKGIHCTGVEPSHAARIRAQQQGVDAVAKIEDLTTAKFDVITLWHVLEHVYDLDNTLIDLKRRLQKGGTIFIAVPNFQSADAKHYKELWAGFDVPRHVWHFSKESMTRLLKNSGLLVTKIIPMKLDAYYVSLLSQKNKARGALSLPGMTSAIFRGYQSNAAAKQLMNYSSLIFVVKNEE